MNEESDAKSVDEFLDKIGIEYADEQDEKLCTEIAKRIKQINDSDEGKMWECTECGRQMKKKYKMEFHIETHLEGFTHICVHCDKIHKTRGALRAHISITHRGEN